MWLYALHQTLLCVEAPSWSIYAGVSKVTAHEVLTTIPHDNLPLLDQSSISEARS
jgi:hypothetical protein